MSLSGRTPLECTTNVRVIGCRPPIIDDTEVSLNDNVARLSERRKAHYFPACIVVSIS